MLALADYRANLHYACGQYLPDTTGPDNEDQFEAARPIRCHWCTEQQRATTAHRDSPHAPYPEALLWPVRRVT